MNAPATVRQTKPRLLIVEDDEGLQRQLRWAYDDYEVLVASDRNAAIDLLRSILAGRRIPTASPRASPRSRRS